MRARVPSCAENLEWQLCALTGRLPGQGPPKIAFATAPKDLHVSWWDHPNTHPTYPCNGNMCDPSGFTVGDVFFAEVIFLSPHISQFLPWPSMTFSLLWHETPLLLG